MASGIAFRTVNRSFRDERPDLMARPDDLRARKVEGVDIRVVAVKRTDGEFVIGTRKRNHRGSILPVAISSNTIVKLDVPFIAEPDLDNLAIGYTVVVPARPVGVHKWIGKEVCSAA